MGETFRIAQKEFYEILKDKRFSEIFTTEEIEVIKSEDITDLEKLRQKIENIPLDYSNPYSDRTPGPIRKVATLIWNGHRFYAEAKNLVKMAKKAFVEKMIEEKKKGSDVEPLKALVKPVTNTIQNFRQFLDAKDTEKNIVWKIVKMGSSLLDTGLEWAEYAKENIDQRSAFAAIDGISDLLQASICIYEEVKKNQEHHDQLENLEIALITIENNLKEAKKRKTNFENYLRNIDGKLSNLTEIVNDIMIVLQNNTDTNCRSNKASLVLDITELRRILSFTDLQKEIKRQKEAMMLTMKLIEDNTGCLPGVQNRIGQDCDWVNQLRKQKLYEILDILKKMFSEIDEGVLVDQMIDQGLPMPDESWTDRRVVDLNFFQRCELRDETYFGQCLTANNQSVDSDPAGHYVSVGGNEFQCYDACKEVPGAMGCQYRRTNCFGSDLSCRGECFVFTEEVRPMEENGIQGIHDITCYKFRERTPGFPGNTFKYKLFMFLTK